MHAQQLQWFKSFFGSGANVSITSSSSDGGNNYYVAGSFKGTFDADPGPGVNMVTSIGTNFDAFIARFTTTGNLKFITFFATSGQDHISTVKPSPNGSVFAVGYNGSGIIFVKMDSLGNIRNQVTFGSLNDEPYYFDFDHSGNIVVTGEYYGTKDFDPGPATSNLVSMGGSDAFFAKYDTTSFQFVWAKSVGSPGADLGDKILIDQQNNIIVGGDYLPYPSSTDDFDPGVGVHSLPIVGINSNAFVCKYDFSGNFIWGKPIIGQQGVLLDDLAFDTTGNIYVYGTFVGGWLSCDPDTLRMSGPMSLTGTHDAFVIKCDSLFRYIHAFKLGGTNYDYAGTLSFASGNKFYVSLLYYDSVDVNHDSLIHNWISTTANHPSVLVCAYDSSMQLLQAFSFHSWIGVIPNPTGLLVPTSDGFYLAGTYNKVCDFNQGYYPEFHTAAGVTDAYLSKYVFRYNTLKGKVFLDMNADSIMQPSESYLSEYWFSESPDNVFRNSDSSGVFRFATDTGAKTVNSLNNPHWKTAPLNYQENFNSFWNADTSLVFAVQPVDSFPEIGTSIIPDENFVRRGFQSMYRITVSNNGTTIPQGVNLKLVMDSLFSYLNANPAPDSISADTLFWYNVAPFVLQNKNFDVTLFLSASAPFSGNEKLIASLYPSFTDSLMSNNTDTLIQPISGSYDPNILVAQPTDTLLPTDHFINYTIHFQNTGSASAVNIVIRDTLSSFLDPTSIQMINSSYPVSFAAFGDGRTSFVFQNIFLPDSSANELQSHGFVSFRVKIRNNFTFGDTINNTAYIYFDYNSPIETNTTKNFFVTPIMSLGANYFGNLNQINVYPNPSTGTFTVKSKGTDGEISVCNLLGETIFSEKIISEKTEVDLSNQANGIYFITVKTEKESVTQKIIIEK